MTNPPQGEAPQPSLDALREERLREILNPAHSALVIVDMQNDFLAPDGKSAQWGHDVEAMRAIIPKIEEVNGMFRGFGRPVIRTITYEDPEFRTTAGQDRFLFFEGNNKEDGVLCLKDTPGAQLYLPPQAGDIVIEKTHGSALQGTRLQEELTRQGIQTVFLAGVKTNRCITRTLHDLAERTDFHVVVLEDCVASDNVQQHEATLAEMKEFYPPVIDSDRLTEEWAKYIPTA